MSETVSITIVLNDTTSSDNLRAEHGFSCWIESGRHRVLFDLGQSLNDNLTHNAEELNIPIDTVTDVVLSHGHYDHTGGLSVLLDRGLRPRMWLHPAALNPKFKAGGVFLGAPFDEETLRSNSADVMWTETSREICDGIHITGQIPRRTDFEDTGGSFFLDGSCTTPDPLIDDQALFIRGAKGTIVVLGCAHAGVINTLNYVRDLTGNSPIRAVIGGMHLGNASPERMAGTIEALELLNIPLIAPGHCTGSRATQMLEDAFPDHVQALQVGSRFEFRTY